MAEVKPKKYKTATYYFPNYQFARIVVSDGNGGSLALKAKNNVISISGEDPQREIKLAGLDAHEGNKKNGGALFFKLKAGAKIERGQECLLDELLELSNNALVSMIEKKTAMTAKMSRGNLIMTILKERGE